MKPFVGEMSLAVLLGDKSVLDPGRRGKIWVGGGGVMGQEKLKNREAADSERLHFVYSQQERKDAVGNTQNALHVHKMYYSPAFSKDHQYIKTACL